jgi:thiosulfate reductase / polysulfide reductase chain A
MVSRRGFLKFGAAAAAATPLLEGRAARAHEEDLTVYGGVDYSHLSGTERDPVATVCGLCPSRCPAIGYVENGYVVKIEGQPDSIRTAGKLCAKGQAGVNQIYDPDRIIYPLRRAGKRGEGKWRRISWDEALSELADRLTVLRDQGNPEKFMFHHGWISASADKLINKVFLASYGTGSIANNTCLGQSARGVAHELTCGRSEDSWDFDNARFVLNFGSNVMEAHTNHVALARRLADGLADRNLRMVTFDVRLSNTAAKSHAWIKIKPGTDLAVVLAMCNVVMNEDLYRGAGEEFLAFCLVTADPHASTADKIAALKDHLAPYSPEWAEEISGVGADLIRDIAVEFAAARPGCVISSRGASANYNGVETERAIQMLAAITGNFDNPGGRCRAVAAKWNYPAGPADKPEPAKLDILEGFAGDVALPAHGVGNQILNMIGDGRAGRPDVYMWFNYNPVFSNGNTQQNIDILKDESLIPMTVAVTPFYDESAALADLILPDAMYLEKYDFEDGVSPSQVPEYYIRQPVVPPQGEARDFKDVCCELAERMGFPLGFDSAEQFVEQSCKLTPDVKSKAGGFRRMKKRGVWHDPEAEPAYYLYRKVVGAEALQEEGVIHDEATGVYWNWKTAGASSESEARSKGYRHTAEAYRGYIAQKLGEKAYVGFEPDWFNKSGHFELYSAILEEKGFAPLPSYVAIPEHLAMSPDEMILSTFRINVQTLSRTQNCMWLDEISVENAAWINPETAATKAIDDGDRIKIKSPLGEIEVVAKVTENVVPGAIAMSSHGGRWEYGRYASGKKAPYGIAVDPPQEELKWWPTDGDHPNRIIPNSPEPISGQQRWMDTVVSVTKA